MPDAQPLIVTDRLTKVYADTRALDGLSLRLHRGGVLGLLGSNGAGKTTAIHILLGLLTPTSGAVSVFGLSPLSHRHTIAKRLNFCSAYAHLPANLKVSENLRVFAKIYNVRDAKRKITELMALFDLERLSGRITGALSSGERTRLNLAKCLLNDPELLLLDEPTASLDPEMADTVRGTLKKVQREKNMGILYTSHNMPEVEAICDRIIFIHEGRTITEGTPGEVLKNFQTDTLEQLFIKIVRARES